MEEATRLGEFKRALAATKDPTQAAFASREVTLDFQRIGAKTRALNAIIAFGMPIYRGQTSLSANIKTARLPRH